MAYEIEVKPQPTDRQIRALWMLGSYLARQYGHRTDKAKDAAAWIRRAVDGEFTQRNPRYDTRLGTGEIDVLEWLPLSSKQAIPGGDDVEAPAVAAKPSRKVAAQPAKLRSVKAKQAPKASKGANGEGFVVKNYFHASTSDSDQRMLFNVYRAALMSYIVEHEPVIDEDMRPFLAALQPADGGFLSTPALRSKYGGDPEYFFDRSFIQGRFREISAGLGVRPEAVAERFLAMCAGMWLIFRISTPPLANIALPKPDGTSPEFGFEDCRINVSLLRVRPHKFLTDRDRLTPRFIYENKAGAAAGIERAEGYVFPMGGKVHLLGRPRRVGVGSPISFSWTEDNGWEHGADEMSEPPERRGLAYATNASGDRVAFYFQARFVHGSRMDNSAAYDAAVEVIKKVVDQYGVATVAQDIESRIAAARAESLSALGEGKVDPLAGVKFSVECPSRQQLEDLFNASKRDVVFRG